MLESLENWYENHWVDFLALKSEFNFESKTETTQNKIENNNSAIQDKAFCITGKLEHHTNRDELVAVIEQNGGRYVTGVTSKTNYLINNDVTSTTGKNKKAKDLNIPIISEQDFLKMIGIM
jgi:DNA ligase (NAD+)